MAAIARFRFPDLPGFADDAIPYAARTTAALLLAYFVAFVAQVPSASSAGITVGIIAQNSSGMALSKAFYRILGTVIGCVVAIILGALFGQDRTMLLFAFAVWMAICGGVAVLLRDFRSYGAALSGYTVAIIAIGGIDDPDGLLLSALNRTAAILIGILAVAVVNSLFGGAMAIDHLVAGLRRQRGTFAGLAIDALEGRGVPDELALTQMAAGVVGLQTEATYAAAEMPGGRRRAHGAQVAIASLLTVISASRTIAGTRDGGSAAVLAYLTAMAAALRAGAVPPPAPAIATPVDALLVERAEMAARSLANADAGLAVLTGGRAALPELVLRQTVDMAAAMIGAARSLIAFGISATFIVLAGWSGATLVLIQQAAFIGLLGTVPSPSKASTSFLIPVLPVAIVVGVVNFLVLPLASGFGALSLWAGGLMFFAALVARHDRLAAMAPAGLIYLTLFLAPSNPETFDFSGFLNTVLQVGLAVIATQLAFGLILPVSPKRRLYRVIAAVALELRHTHRSASRPHDPAVAQALLYDRLVRALAWLGPATVARHRLLSHTYRLGAADIAIRRIHQGLDQACRDAPELRAVAAYALLCLRLIDMPGLLGAADALLAEPAAARSPIAIRQAVSGMADLAFQEGLSELARTEQTTGQTLGIGGRASRFMQLMTG